MDSSDLLLFTQVAQSGSFSQAAKRLGMPVSTVSRRVAALEAGLGVSLLIRTTRSLRVTETGRAYLEHGRAIAAELEKAEALASGLASTPQGTLKITAANDFGNRFLGGMVSRFLKDHPKVGVEVVLTERVVDLVGEGFDLAIRMGELEDSSLLAKRIGSLEMQVYASPAYLKKHGSPVNPSDLKRFDCVRFGGDQDLDADVWHLSGKAGDIRVPVSGRILANHMSLVRDWVMAGEGLGLMPHFLCAEEVESGRLKVVLKDWHGPAGPIHVVYPNQRFVSPKVRAFVESLSEACAEVKWKIR